MSNNFVNKVDRESSLNSRRIGKKIICLIISFLMCLSLIGLFLSAELGLGVYRHNGITSAVNSSQYKEKAYKEFDNNFTSLLKDNGITLSIDEKVMTETMFTLDCSNSIKAALNGKGSKVDTKNIEKTLADNIKKAFGKAGTALSEADIKNINKIAKDCTGYYESYAEFTFGDYYYVNRVKLEKLLTVLVPVCLVILIVGGLLLMKLNRRKHRTYRYMAFAFVGAFFGDIAVFLRLFLSKSEVVNSNMEYYGYFIGSLYDALIAPFVFSCIIMVVIAVYLIKMVRNGKKRIH